MYTNYFGLKEKPFSIAPNPKYLYMSAQHQDALAHLLYGLQEGEGFVLLTGDIGTGKTTICRSLLEQIPSHVEVAYIFNPKLSIADLLLSICDEFKIKLKEKNTSIKRVIARINMHLLQQHALGKHSVLIIDEAQNLTIDVLEQIRLLTNLETNSKKLLQIILIGQPELKDVFLKPELEQLAQRVTARYHIGPLSTREVDRYIRHRIFIAGGPQAALFDKQAVKTLHRVTRGVPRLINTVADRALLAAYSQSHAQVSAKEIKAAAKELINRPPPQIFSLTKLQTQQLAGAMSLLIFAFAAGNLFQRTQFNDTTPPVGMLNVPTDTALQAITDAGNSSQPYQTRFTGKPAPSSQISSLSSQYTENLFPAKLNSLDYRLAAHKALLQRWGISAPITNPSSFCETAASHQLQCLNTQGNMARLIKLNRPAVVQLKTSINTSNTAFISRITNDNRVELIVAGRTHSLSARQFQHIWTGKLTLLWKPPTAYSKAISSRSSATEISWFRKQLSALTAKADNTNAPVFIAPIAIQIKRFQDTVGLKPDGFAGPETIILLDNLLGSDSPSIREAG